MEKLLVSPNPHIHAPVSTKTLMRDVIIALIPAVICSFVFYGWREMLLMAVSIASCLLLEWSITRYLLKKRLYEVEELLPPEFIRINKSSIANRKRIRRFTTTISGAVDAEFKSGFKEYVSRRCFADLKRRYGL